MLTIDDFPIIIILRISLDNYYFCAKIAISLTIQRLDIDLTPEICTLTDLLKNPIF